MPPAEAEAAERSPDAPKGYVVLAIGLPGSGKTTWFRRRGVTPLSSDLLRNILFDDVEEQRYQGLVFSTLRSLLRARLIAPHALELRGRHQPLHPRAPPVDQDGPELSATRCKRSFSTFPSKSAWTATASATAPSGEDIMRKMGRKAEGAGV